MLAQYFHLADEIIVLGNRKIQTRGTWDELKSELSQIAKVQMAGSETGHDVPREMRSVSGIAQVMLREDAADDLARKTGDFALYGRISTSFPPLRVQN